MIEISAGWVARECNGRCDADPAIIVTGPVVADSRQVRSGSMFVAIPGDKVDGADFAAQAVAHGAVLVLAQRPLPGLPTVVVDDVTLALGHLAHQVTMYLIHTAMPTVIAVTGSAGKTTTKDLLAALVSRSPGDTVAPQGSLNSEIGLPLTVLTATDHTRTMVLEMGADKPGDIAYLTRIAYPQIAVILNVGTAHIGLFGSQDAIAATKGEVLDEMFPGGTAVLNADDERVLAMRERAQRRGIRVVSFGRAENADVGAEEVAVDAAGRASFVLRVDRLACANPQLRDRFELAQYANILEIDDGQVLRLPVRLRLVGEHHVTNALAAAAAALVAGIAVDVIAARLSAAEPASPHRMAVAQRLDEITVIDDSYNANPESMRAAVQTLAMMAGRERRSVAVLGEMRELGTESQVAHETIGRLVVQLNIALLVVVGDEAWHIVDGAEQVGTPDVPGRTNVAFARDIAGARAVLAEQLRPGDIVLVKASRYSLGGSGLLPLADELISAGTPQGGTR
jgi:UDP-N-acetylmuramoyl-tripeptide--D-alanyl-D-alanine ligase